MTQVLYWVSGEFLLKKRANGGAVILYRSLLVSILICAAVLPIKSYFAPNTVLHFSLDQLKTEVGEMIPWFGAVFAGAYAAFYTRFSSQWSYLASLYNEMMSICVTSPPGSIPNKSFVNWQAAFIEDAMDVHLARKSMFSAAISDMLKNPNIVFAFHSFTKNGEDRLDELASDLGVTPAAPLEFGSFGPAGEQQGSGA